MGACPIGRLIRASCPLLAVPVIVCDLSSVAVSPVAISYPASILLLCYLLQVATCPLSPGAQIHLDCL